MSNWLKITYKTNADPVIQAWLDECAGEIETEVEKRMRNLMIYGPTHPEVTNTSARKEDRQADRQVDKDLPPSSGR